MAGRVEMRYSEAFKLHVVRELERGEIENITTASRRYGITGATTVRRWVLRYGKNHLLRKVVRVETPEERDQVKQLQEEVRRLKAVVADVTVEKYIAQSTLEVVSEELGATPEQVEAAKKNAAARLDTGPRPKEKRARP